MGRSTTIRFFGFGLVALSLGAVACAAGDDGEGGGNNGTGGLVGGVTGGTGGTTGATGGTTGVTGGTTGATGGTTGATGGTTSVSVECAGTGFGFDAGYVDTGTLCGYGWTATFGQGETMDPACGTEPCFEEATEFCASASIPQGEEWVSADEPGVHTGIVLGFNVAESSDGSASGAYTTSGSGLTVNYSFTASGGTESGTRVVIESGGVEYCADAASGTPIAWGDFQNECWEGGANTPFTAGSPITKVSVQILGSYEAALTVSDFCITGASVQ